jgi:hypothetical protein
MSRGLRSLIHHATRASGVHRGGASAPAPVSPWPFIWNVQGQSDGTLTLCTSQQSVTVSNVTGAVVPASVTKSAKFNASIDHFIVDMGATRTFANDGSFRAEILMKMSGVSATISALQFFVNNPVSNYGRLDIAHSLGAGDMHDWNTGTGGTGTARGKESVTWTYGSPLSGWCAHQMEVNLATNTYKSRILGRDSGNTGAQDSGWKTRVFSASIAETPFRYIRVHAYTSISVTAEVGQIWVGQITDSFPDGALLTNNFGV